MSRTKPVVSRTDAIVEIAISLREPFDRIEIRAKILMKQSIGRVGIDIGWRMRSRAIAQELVRRRT